MNILENDYTEKTCPAVDALLAIGKAEKNLNSESTFTKIYNMDQCTRLIIDTFPF